MQGVLCTAGKITTRELDIPKPDAGEALVQIHLAGICGTDHAIANGYLPFQGVLGHEFIGTVVKDHSNSSQQNEVSGKRVVADINISCGQCARCMAQQPTHCTTRRTLGIRDKDGVFAQFCVIPERNLYTVPDTVPDHHALFAEPLAAALHITEQIDLDTFDSVLLLGSGRLGQLLARVLWAHGKPFTAAARHPMQAALLEACGCRIVQSTKGLLQQHRFDLVIEATGSAQGLSDAIQLCQPLGTVVMKSSYAGKVPVPMGDAVVNEITLTGSRCGDISAALTFLAEQNLDLNELISERHSLGDATHAFQRSASPDTNKVIFGMDT